MMISKRDLDTPLLLTAPTPRRVAGEALANAAVLTTEQATWLRKALVFHGVCTGPREAESHAVVDLGPLPDALRALDVTRAPLTRDQKSRVRTFITGVHTEALRAPQSHNPRKAPHQPPAFHESFAPMAEFVGPKG